MTLRRKDVFVALAIVLAFAVVAAVKIHTTAENTAAARDTYSSTDTNAGGYAVYAALLEREGVRVGAFDRHPAELDAATDTLIEAYAPLDAATQPDEARPALDLDDLRGWVERGGRLVVIGVDARVAARERALLGRPMVIEATRSGGPFTGPLAPGLAQLAPRNAVRFEAAAPNDRVALADAGGPLVIDVRLGRGTVRYLDAGGLFANRAIALHDNARLAYALARPSRPHGAVLFDEGLHGAIVDPSWWSISPAWLRVMVCGLALIAVLALAGGALRLGPPFVPPVREPTSAAFLDAVTALYERAHIVPADV